MVGKVLPKKKKRKNEFKKRKEKGKKKILKCLLLKQIYPFPALLQLSRFILTLHSSLH